MENTKKQIKEEIEKTLYEVDRMKQNLKSQKSYLQYLYECIKEIEQQETKTKI